MNARLLLDTLRLAETWPEYAQLELASIVAAIDAQVHAGVYKPSPEELAGIDAGLADIAAGGVVSEAEIEALFEQHRPR